VTRVLTLVFHVITPVKNSDFRHKIVIDRGDRSDRDTFSISLRLMETICHIPYLIGNTKNTMNTYDNTPVNTGNTIKHNFGGYQIEN